MRSLLNYPLLVLVFSLVTFYLAGWVGAVLRKRRGEVAKDEREDFSLIMTGTLTLLALIIGFTFSMAINRYDLRKNYEEAEANAIGTEYVRLDFLPAADAANAKALLVKYLDQRILFYQSRYGLELQQISMPGLWCCRANYGPRCGRGGAETDAGDGACCCRDE